ncbi:MAG: DUF177 domain-containing protein [Synergistales bacterium]|nr:DUF177 domain-containing protein [Synergistales bacterium]
MAYTSAPPYWDFPVRPGLVDAPQEERYEWSSTEHFAIAYWGQEYSFPQGITAGATTRWEQGVFQVQLHVEGAAVVPCSRCLRPVELALQSDFLYFYVLKSRAENDEDQGFDDEEHFILVDSWPETLNIAPLVWECLVEVLPPAVLCTKDCKGICPTCGADLNTEECTCSGQEIDPRLEQLEKLKQQFPEADKGGE